MKKVYFFCDSQMNILTSYFVMKIYFDTSQYQNFLFVYNNSNNSTICANRAAKLNIWNRVEVIESAYKSLAEMSVIGDKFQFHQEDIVYIYALQNPFARLIYKKADQSDSKIRIIDEGVTLFNSFLKWQKEHPEEILADINVSDKQIEGWCYTPQMYHLPDNVVIKKIELSKALEDEKQCELMQKEVRDIFDIKDEYVPQVIYFDQYYSLEGRATPIIEKYLLKKLAIVCSELDFAVKKHPMERGFDAKFSELEVPIMVSSNSPWEAIYFVNIFKKSNRKMICITGYSTAISTPLLMYGDKDYYIVLLKKIYDEYLKPIENIGDAFYTRIKELESINIYIPENYDEFQNIMSNLTGKKFYYGDRLKAYDHVMFCNLCKKEIQENESVLLCNLDIYRDEKDVYRMRKEIVFDEENFRISYDIPKQFSGEEYTYKWRPCEYAFISLKDVEIIVGTGENEKRYTMDHLEPENAIIIKKDGYMETQYYKPSYLLKIQIENSNNIVIQGKWNVDFDKNRLINSIEENYINFIACKEKKQNEMMQQIKVENELIIEKMQMEYLSKSQEMAELEKMHRGMIASYKKRIYDLENSFSWKATKPLRFLLSKIRFGLRHFPKG